MVESTIVSTMESYTKKQIANFLGVSPRTIADDAAYLNLKPEQGDRGLKLFSTSDFNLIQQLREHCADKANTRESFVPSSEIEILEEEKPLVTKYDSIEVSGDNYSHSLAQGFAQDPLYDLKLLQRISDRGLILPSSRLAPILMISPEELNCHRIYHHCGFVLTRTGKTADEFAWQVTLDTSLSSHDPLEDLDLLQKISDRRYLLPSKRLAPILGISAAQLNRYKIYVHCGFVISREISVRGKILWKVASNNS
jgi:hypothetical protein